MFGGFFTITDATHKQFGEGSFDKGLFIRIPYNSISPYESRAGLFDLVRPIQGDGGARVHVPGRLYGLVSEYSENQLNKSWATIWR